MADAETIKTAIKLCIDPNSICAPCAYKKQQACVTALLADALAVIESLQVENKIIIENGAELDKQRTEFALTINSLRLENNRLKAQMIGGGKG